MRSLIELRKNHPNLHRRKFFQDRKIDPEPDRSAGGPEGDILWIRPDGKEMSQEEWHAGWVRCVGMLLNGQELLGQNFPAAQLSDLKILVQWQSLFQSHLQRLDLIAPDGSLYQSFSRPLTAGDADAPVETLLPVNGTWITRYGLYGAWCIEAFLDQQEQPITSSRLVIASPR